MRGDTFVTCHSGLSVRKKRKGGRGVMETPQPPTSNMKAQCSSHLTTRRTTIIGLLTAASCLFGLVCGPPTTALAQDALALDSIPYAVQVSATPIAGTPWKIRLSWPAAKDADGNDDPTGNCYVYRKARKIIASEKSNGFRKKNSRQPERYSRADRWPMCDP